MVSALATDGFAVAVIVGGADRMPTIVVISAIIAIAQGAAPKFADRNLL